MSDTSVSRILSLEVCKIFVGGRRESLEMII